MFIIYYFYKENKCIIYLFYVNIFLSPYITILFCLEDKDSSIPGPSEEERGLDPVHNRAGLHPKPGHQD